MKPPPPNKFAQSFEENENLDPFEYFEDLPKSNFVNVVKNELWLFKNLQKKSTLSKFKKHILDPIPVRNGRPLKLPPLKLKNSFYTFDSSNHHKLDFPSNMEILKCKFGKYYEDCILRDFFKFNSSDLEKTIQHCSLSIVWNLYTSFRQRGDINEVH